MKKPNAKRFAAALALLTGSLLATGCGSSDPAPGAVVPGVGGYAPGLVGGTCIPIAQQIPFTFNSVRFDSANLIAGTIPRVGQTFGQVAVGGAVPQIGYGVTGGYSMARQTVDGTLQVMVTTGNTQMGGYAGGAQPYGLGTVPTLASGYGVLQISPAAQQDIMYHVQMGQIQIPGFAAGMMNPGAYPGMYPGAYPQAYPQANAAGLNGLCASQLAINVGHYNSTIHTGEVFLYLNNTQSGYRLFFGKMQ